LKSAAERLTNERCAAAKQLEKEIEKALHELNMEKAVFSVSVRSQEYSANGADFVEFMIATNPGEDLKPLVKIASGGELSRVMLAIKSILAKSDDVDTLIFDEIDTGVSGGAAQKIADKLTAIGKTKQVICITHLPQLASAADNHFLKIKDVDGDIARTTLKPLDFDGRVAELARIVGGGAAGIEYAKEMLRKQ
jgi:DNA repair protein RecN (Recombination protein N)